MCLKYYLLEDFDPDLDFGHNKIVALNPVPMSELRKRNIAYTIPEDYYDEKQLRQNEKNFFQEELDWFSSFDALIKKHVFFCRENHISLARTFYNRIKYFTNSLLIQCSIISTLVQVISESAGHIVYVKNHGYEKETLCKE